MKSGLGLPGRNREAALAWTLLVIAGLLEVVWAFFMKQADGFSKPGPSAIAILTMIASFALLSVSMKTLPLGTAYTVWTGVGAVGAFIVGIAVLGESASPVRLIAAALILMGLVLMRLADASPAPPVPREISRTPDVNHRTTVQE